MTRTKNFSWKTDGNPALVATLLLNTATCDLLLAEVELPPSPPPPLGASSTSGDHQDLH